MRSPVTLALALLVAVASLVRAESGIPHAGIRAVADGRDATGGCPPCGASESGLDATRVDVGPRRVLVDIRLPETVDPAGAPVRLVVARDGRTLLCSQLRVGAQRLAPGRALLRRGSGGRWRLGVTLPRDAVGVGAWRLLLHTPTACLGRALVIPPPRGTLAP